MSVTRRGLAQHSRLLKAAWCTPKYARNRIPPSISNFAWPNVHTRHRSSSASGPSGYTTSDLHTGWLNRNNVSTFLTVLLIFGGGATAFGLYEFYSSFTLWPVELRQDLRAGIRAKNKGDLGLSERFLSRAYQTALTLPLSALGADPYLKLSGIAAILAEVAPERRAKNTLRSVWEKGDPSLSRFAPPSGTMGAGSAVDGDGGWSTYKLTNEERLRRVAIACKLAELNDETDEEEEWLVWAVEEVLQLAGVQGQTNADVKRGEAVPSTTQRQSKVNDGVDSKSRSVVLAELELPAWMHKCDLGAPLAALGAVYARKGNIDYAMPLYLQAISLLLPPKTDSVSIDDHCQAAQLMNNLSELIMRRPPTPEIRHQAEAWTRQAHGAIQRAQAMPLPRRGWFTSGDESSREVCDQVLGVVLFNLGMLREMDDDNATARSLYDQSAKQCEQVGLAEGVIQARQALRRLGNARTSREAKP